MASSRAKTAVIAQPTFLPWVGWFDLADQADILILLDDVAFSKQSWQQRNRIRNAKGLSYLTLPVKTAGRLGQLILDTELAGDDLVSRISGSISASYAKAPYFSEYFGSLIDVISTAASTGKLVELNSALIGWFMKAFGIAVPVVRSSSLSVAGQRGEHVALLCESVGARRYLSPVGAKEYLLEDIAEFESRGITVQLHSYEHPVYRQQYSPFEAYASALDLLMNEGSESLDIIRSGRLESISLMARGRIEEVER